MQAILPFAIAVVLMIAPVPPAQAQTTFPMMCRPDASMAMILSPRGTNWTRIELRFRKAAFGFDVRRPRPGECAWADRAINAAEPSLMAIEVGVPIWVQFSLTGAGVAGAGAVGGISRSEQERTEFILRVTRTSPCFVVNVFNTGCGFFTITVLEDGC